MNTSTSGMRVAPAERRCAHLSELGEQCVAYATRTGMCAGHSGAGVAARPSHHALRSAAVRQTKAAERKRTFQDRLAQQLEEHAEAIVERLMEIVWSGSDADALRAIEAMANRVYGRPTARVETTVAETPRSVEAIRAMTSEQRHALLLRLEQRGLRLVEDVPCPGTPG